MCGMAPRYVALLWTLLNPLTLLSIEANQELFHQCCNSYIEDCHIKLVNNWS